MGTRDRCSTPAHSRLLHSLRQLFRHRALVQSLVARELKARYRGSTLGLLWSFVNPLLLLSIYTFVFTSVMPAARSAGIEHFSLFLFCGILPWTWFSSSLLESANVLIAGGNLIRKVLFPAEILPIVTVFAGLVHFCLGLPILAAFFVYYRVPVTAADLVWLPLIVFAQLLLTLGFAFLLSALTVHFRDLRDLLANVLTLGFFLTPIIYPLSQAPGLGSAAAESESIHHPRRVLSGGSRRAGAVHGLASPPGICRRVGAGVCGRLFRLRSAA